MRRFAILFTARRRGRGAGRPAARAARGLGHPVLGEGDGRRRGAVAARLRDGGLAPRDGSDHRRLGPGGRRHLPRPVLRDEPAEDPGHDLQGRHELLERRDARGQPVRRALVVPHGARPAARGGRQDPLAAPRRRQLPLRRLAQRQEDRRRREDGRRLPPPRDRRDRRREARSECPRRPRLRPEAGRPRHHLRGLEPHAAGQGDGPLPPGHPHRHAARWRFGTRRS